MSIGAGEHPLINRQGVGFLDVVGHCGGLVKSPINDGLLWTGWRYHAN